FRFLLSHCVQRAAKILFGGARGRAIFGCIARGVRQTESKPDAGPPGEEPSMTRKPRLLYSPDGLETTHSIDEDPTAAQAGFDEMHMLVRPAVDENASDVHLRAGSPPRLRIDGELLQMKGFIPTEDMMWRFFRGMMSRELIQRFERTHEADFS